MTEDLRAITRTPRIVDLGQSYSTSVGVSVDLVTQIVEELLENAGD